MQITAVIACALIPVGFIVLGGLTFARWMSVPSDRSMMLSLASALAGLTLVLFSGVATGVMWALT